MGFLLEGSPISTEVNSLTKALPPQLLTLAWWPDLERVLLVPNFFHLRMMEATVFLWTFNEAEMCWYPFSGLCLDTNRRSANNSFDLIG